MDSIIKQKFRKIHFIQIQLSFILIILNSCVKGKKKKLYSWCSILCTIIFCLEDHWIVHMFLWIETKIS